MKYIKVAVPVPLRMSFTYSMSDEQANLHTNLKGKRVLVPFGNRKLVGICVDEHADENLENAKSIHEVLDVIESINEQQFQLALWLADYYQYAMGEVLFTMLPASLRKATPLNEQQEKWLALCKANNNHVKLPAKQQALFSYLQESAKPLLKVKQLFSTSVIKGLKEKQLVEEVLREKTINPWQAQITLSQKYSANVEQSIAIASINEASGFCGFLLEGVTGSGKTEVYLQAIEQRLLRGQQILILVPEIGLTPQTVTRFEERFGPIVCAIHSGLTDNQRLAIWHQARRGDAGIFIGTRSSIFLPFPNLGMIIVDEEHDESYKQQDGLRYHARDLAVYRANLSNIPLVLGSATPSLESLHNALTQKYRYLQLIKRAGHAAMPSQHLLNITGQELQCGISSGLLDKIKVQLEQGNQVLIFVNRRGFAPAMHCHQCGYVATCNGCEAPFTVHKTTHNLQCHRCGNIAALPKHCPECKSSELVTQGIGTEQLEEFLGHYLSPFKCVRIDSDSTRSKINFNRMLSDIHNKEYQVLIGTQILSKGHHFPDVTLAVMLNVDALLFSGDFRAPERLGQVITQLSGRAGRANKAGEVWMQTHQPGHPLLQDLINNGFGDFSRTLLAERKAAKLPPFSFQALFRAEAESPHKATEFLRYISTMLTQFTHAKVLGPMPCLIEKKQARYRFQVIVQSESRHYLQSLLSQVLEQADSHKLGKQIRWHVDVQPLDFS